MIMFAVLIAFFNTAVKSGANEITSTSKSEGEANYGIFLSSMSNDLVFLELIIISMGTFIWGFGDLF